MILSSNEKIRTQFLQNLLTTNNKLESNLGQVKLNHLHRIALSLGLDSQLSSKDNSKKSNTILKVVKNSSHQTAEKEQLYPFTVTLDSEESNYIGLEIEGP